MLGALCSGNGIPRAARSLLTAWAGSGRRSRRSCTGAGAEESSRRGRRAWRAGSGRPLFPRDGRSKRRSGKDAERGRQQPPRPSNAGLLLLRSSRARSQRLAQPLALAARPRSSAGALLLPQPRLDPGALPNTSSAPPPAPPPPAPRPSAFLGLRGGVGGGAERAEKGRPRTATPEPGRCLLAAARVG